MRSLLAPLARVDGRLARLSGQYPACLPRESQEDCACGTGVRGRVWPELHIGTVIKQRKKKRVVEMTRQMVHGVLEQAENLLQRSQGGTVLNTAFSERLHATFRERLASLTRKSRHAARRLQALETGMYLIGCSYNFCVVHHELSKPSHLGSPCTPAMAAGLTDHVWSIWELLHYHVAPPPWVERKRRGWSGKKAKPISPVDKHPLVRLRKGVLCSTTV